MAYDVQQLLKMSQEELDALFTQSPAGQDALESMGLIAVR